MKRATQLAFLLIALSGISGLLRLPIVINKIQLFEPLFLVAFCLFLVKILRGVKSWSWREFALFFNPIDGALLIFGGLTLLSFATHPSFTVFLECVGNFYMLTIYFFFSRLVYREGAFDFLQKAWKWTALLTAFCCLFGLIYFYQTDSDRYVTVYQNSPYFGDIIRMSGFSASSNNAASVLVFSFIFSFPILKGSQKWLLWAMLGMSVATLSKEALYCVGLILLLFSLKILGNWLTKNQILKLGAVAYAVFWLSCGTSTLWLFSWKTDNLPISESTIAFGKLHLEPTCYYHLFAAALQNIQNAPIFGIGLGNFQTTVDQFKAVGLYPNSCYSYENHDLYWGVWAQLGIGFLLFLAVFFRALWKTMYSIWQQQPTYRTWVKAFGTCFLFIGVDAFGQVGAIHFRHYWIILGLLSGLYAYLRRVEN